MRNTRTMRLMITAVLAAGMLIGQSAAAQPDARPIPLKVAVSSYLSYAPFFIAEEEGFFVEQGLAVELLRVSSEAALIPALVQGQVDALAAAIMPAYVNVIARGGEMKIVAGRGHYATEGCTYSGIMARRDLVESGALKTAADLAGLRVSTERTTTSYYRFDKLLSTGGLTLGDVRIVDLPVAAELDAFATDALDIATVSEPWLTRLRRGGHAVLFARASDYLPDFQFGYLLYGPSLLTDNPEAGERFLTAYLKATRQLNRDGKSPRHLAILMKHTSLDEATLEEACWPHLDDDGRVRVQSLEQYQEWALEHGLIDRIVSTEEMHDPRFLEAANRSLAESGGGP